MKRAVLTVLVATLVLSLSAFDVQAKRLGGGSSSGMKRATPQQSADANKGTPPQQAAPAPQQAAAPAVPAAAGAAAAAAPKRNWMGPIAGLAAGLGIAALASHFGMGGALANMMTMLLIGVAAMFLIGFLMRRFGGKKTQPESQLQGMQFAGAPFQAQSQSQSQQQQQPQPLAQQPVPAYAEQAAQAAQAAPVMAAAAAAAVASSAPSKADDFDSAGFEQLAKRVFIRLQAANDSGDQADLRRFTTPEMYGVVQQELLDRKGAVQRTDVLQLDARVIERVQEDGQQIVSVRFWGLIREQSESAAVNFDEVWHLVRPLDGSQEWAIAGIQSSSPLTI